MDSQITITGMDEPMDFQSYWNSRGQLIIEESYIKNPDADPIESIKICCNMVYKDIIEYALKRIEKSNER